jgi:Restriction endonuclease fold toxin 7
MITSSSLTQLAAELRALVTTLETVQLQGAAVASALATNTEAMPSLWHGPRAHAVLGAGAAYHTAVFGSGSSSGWTGTVTSVVGVIGRWATSADEYAGYLSGPEATLASDAVSPEDVTAHDRAAGEIEELGAEWRRTCTSYAGELDSYRAPLTAAIDTLTFSGDFPYPPLEGTQYAAIAYEFSLLASMPLSMLDPSGQLQRERQGRLDGLFSTDMGNLVFTIIETAHEEDLGERDEHWSMDDLLAASDPDRVRGYIQQIYAESGEPLNDDVLDLLVEETVATALSIRAGRSDDWEDYDEDLGFFEHGFGEWLREDFAGPAAAFVTTVGCMAIVTAGSGGTLTAPAAGGCAVAGGAVGDAVNAWTNGGDFVDGLEAAANPVNRTVNFATGFAVQGLANRFLPAPSAAGVAASRQTGIIGEQIAGITPALKVRIPSMSGTANYRIPDALTATTLTEVKNVATLSYTHQIDDFLQYAQSQGMTFNLVVRSNTTLSGPLQSLVASGEINLIRMLPP